MYVQIAGKSQKPRILVVRSRKLKTSHFRTLHCDAHALRAEASRGDVALVAAWSTTYGPPNESLSEEIANLGLGSLLL